MKTRRAADRVMIMTTQTYNVYADLALHTWFMVPYLTELNQRVGLPTATATTDKIMTRVVLEISDANNNPSKTV